MKKKSFETYATYEHTAKYAFPSMANSNYQTKPKLKFLFWWGGEGILNTCYNYSHWLSIVFHPVAGKSLWKQEVYELYCLFEYK